MVRIDLIKLSSKMDSNGLYEDPEYKLAYNSYKNIYHSIMTRGKYIIPGIDVPKVMSGQPIILDISNMSNLINKRYYVSTKADGLRFFMFFSNNLRETSDDKNFLKTESDRVRDIFFVDNLMNFWIIKTGDTIINEKLPKVSHMNLCLFDGEILMWGTLNTVKEDGKVVRYILTNRKENNIEYEPLITFLAFDMLYGPIDSVVNLDDMKDISEKNPNEPVLNFRNSVGMLDFKRGELWSTDNRRMILENVIYHKLSPFYTYIKEIKRKYNVNFTIAINPFIPFNELLEHKNIYEYMRKLYKNEITRRLEENLMENNLYKVSKKLIDKDAELHYLKKLPIDPMESSDSYGSGLLTDGLIFTPIDDEYLIGNWNFCNNKQYKWKPTDMSTIDVEVGDLLDQGPPLIYKALVHNKEYKYDDKMITIVSKVRLTRGDIVEVLVSDLNNDVLEGKLLKIRHNKDTSNSVKTITTTLNTIKYGSDDLLNTVITFKKYGYDRTIREHPETVTYINNFIDESYKYRCLLSKEPYKFINKMKTNNIMNMLNKVVNFGSINDKEKYELENRMILSNKYAYSRCLIKQILNSKYPIVMLYRLLGSSNYRSNWILLDDTFVLESIEIKEEMESERLNFGSINNVELYPELYVNKYVLSKEIRVDLTKLSLEELKTIIINCLVPDKSIRKEIFEYIEHNYLKLSSITIIENVFNKHTNYSSSNTKIYSPDIVSKNTNLFHVRYVCQSRYSIMSLSNFWKVDVIEYGESIYDINNAVVLAMKGPLRIKPEKILSKDDELRYSYTKCRVEIEYSPGAYFNDIINYLKEDTINSESGVNVIDTKLSNDVLVNNNGLIEKKILFYNILSKVGETSNLYELEKNINDLLMRVQLDYVINDLYMLQFNLLNLFFQ